MSDRNAMTLKPNRRIAMRASLAALLGGTLMAAGCVTINIYFPAAAAEKAADRIIDEVWQLKSGIPAPGVKPAVK